jgi:hypothetical protein
MGYNDFGKKIGIVKYKGAGAFDLEIKPERDISEDKRAYYGCKIVYEMFENSDQAPTNPKQLTEDRFTRKKKESFIFQPEDSGKRVYFSLRYENSKGKSGPWCPIFSAVIP